MKKPQNYFGFAWSNPADGYNEEFINSKEWKKDTAKTKKRWKKYQKQNKEFGFDETETWNLDNTIIQFTLPRLKYFRENLIGYPSELTEKKWEKILDKIIWSFEQSVDDYENCPSTIEDIKKYYKKVQKGNELFGKYLSNFWS